jgi:hypothetical protein
MTLPVSVRVCVCACVRVCVCYACVAQLLCKATRSQWVGSAHALLFCNIHACMYQVTLIYYYYIILRIIQQMKLSAVQAAPVAEAGDEAAAEGVHRVLPTRSPPSCRLAQRCTTRWVAREGLAHGAAQDGTWR